MYDESDFKRVSLIATKAHITIPAGAFDAKLHRELKQPALDRNGYPRDAVYSSSPSDEGEASEADTTEATKEAK